MKSPFLSRLLQFACKQHKCRRKRRPKSRNGHRHSSDVAQHLELAGSGAMVAGAWQQLWFPFALGSIAVLVVWMYRVKNRLELHRLQQLSADYLLNAATGIA